MSVESLMTQTVEVLPYDEGAVDEYNDPTPGWGEPIETKAYLEKRSGDEETEDRETAVSRWRLFLPATATLTHRDRVTYGLYTFEIDGTVEEIWNPRLRRAHHIEADLKLVEDAIQGGGS